MWQAHVAGCPYVLWGLVNHDDGGITGIFYYSDLCGASAADGTVANGKFQIPVTPILGPGPAGSISGPRLPDGAMQSTMTGSGCADTS
jgi:hypothetical protein